MKSMVLPNETRADFSYDNLDRLLNLVNQTNEGKALNSYAYRFNSQGLRDRVTYANGNYAAFTYDAVGQLTDEHYKTAQDSSLLQLTYTYDKAGNRLTKKYDNDANRVENYTINGYNQVTAVSGARGKFINVTGLVEDANLESGDTILISLAMAFYLELLCKCLASIIPSIHMFSISHIIIKRMSIVFLGFIPAKNMVSKRIYLFFGLRPAFLIFKSRDRILPIRTIKLSSPNGRPVLWCFSYLSWKSFDSFSFR